MLARSFVRSTLFTALIALTFSARAAVTNVAYWRLGESDPGAGNGAIATSTTNQLGGTMTLANSPRYTNDVAPAATTIGSTLGLPFNGVNQYGSHPLVSTLTNNFGIELWVKPAVTNLTQCIAYNGNSGANGWGLYIHGGQFKGLFGGSSLFPETNAPAGTNAWAYLALVRDNGTNVLYVNGAPVFTNSAAPRVPTGNFAVASQAQALGNELFTGALDELRVFSFAPGGFSTNDLLLNADPVVTTTANLGPGSLRSAIAAARPGDTITFAPNLSGQTITLSGTITLTNNLNINAASLPAGITLRGGGSTRLFYITNGPTITMNNLTLTNGRVVAATDNGAGGAIDAVDGTLVLTRCTLAGNSTTGIGNGGAIYSFGPLTLNECTLAGNSAAGGGGAIISFGPLTLNRCTLTGNSATNSGGAITALGPAALNQCTFSGNTSGSSGGAIRCDTATLIQCTLAGNSASTGGGISCTGSASLTNSIVAGNTALTAANISGSSSGANNLTSGTPLLAPLGHYGGPTMTMPPLLGSLAIDTGTDSVTNSLATDQRGFPRRVGARVDIGAVESGSMIPGFDYSVVTLTNDILSDGLGGVSLRTAAAHVPANGTITFTNTLSGRTITLSNEIVLAKSLNITASNLPTNIIISGGGGSNRIFYIENNAAVALNNLTLTGGNGAGAADSGLGGAIQQLNGTLTLTRCTLAGNTSTNAGGYGGAINSSGSLTLSQCTLSGNSTAGNGGAINGINAVLNQCTLSGNSAGIGGGAIYALFSASLSQCTISGNSAASNGGGLFVAGSAALTNTIVAGNAGGDLFGSVSSVNSLTNVNPMLAPLGNYGGPTQTRPPLPGSPAVDAGVNSVTNAFTTDQRGFPRLVGAQVDIGAVESGTPIPGFDYSVVTITNDILTDGFGGVSLRTAVAGIPTNGTITFAANLSGLTITLSNEIILTKSLHITATNLPAGITLSGGGRSRLFYVNYNPAITMTALTLTGGNGAGSGTSGYGGAINVLSGSLGLTRCLLSSNAATGASASGGAIFSSGTLALNQCTLAENSAGNDGGAIRAGGPTTLTQCTLAGNSAGGDGGGVHFGTVSGSSLAFIQCTVTDNNAATGGGISIQSGNLIATNSIIAGNSAPVGTNVVGSFTASVSNLVSGDPRLAPLGNYGGPIPTRPPLFGSPAIDTGLNSVTNLFSTDQRGFPRRVGAQVDIGAVESGTSIPGYDYSIVTTTNDVLSDGVDGISLRTAVARAANNSTVTFSGSLSGQTIALNSEIILNKRLNFNGSNLTANVILNGRGATRIFTVTSNAAIRMNNLTFTGGNGGGAQNNHGGGAIYLFNGTLTLNRCTLSGNSALIGGAIFSEGDLILNQCTLSGNSSEGDGGAIEVYDGTLALTQCTLVGNATTGAGSRGGAVHSYGPASVNRCTVVGNTAYASGGAFSSSLPGLTLIQCTVTGNSAPSGGAISGTAISTNSIIAGNVATNYPNLTAPLAFGGVSNLTSGDPMLAPLGNYGGPTMTMPPLPGSPAIEAGQDSVTNSFTTDQRGQPRLIGAHVDLGAVEGAFDSSVPLMNTTKLGNGSVQFGFNNLSGLNYRVLASTNVAAPLHTWSHLGAAVESPAGTFTFTDTQATNHPLRFYRVIPP